MHSLSIGEKIISILRIHIELTRDFGQRCYQFIVICIDKPTDFRVVIPLRHERGHNDKRHNERE